MAIERAVDRFAAEIGMDPADVRRRNMVPRFLDGYTTAIGTAYDVGDFPASLDQVLDAAGYAGLRAEQDRRRAEGDRQLLGIGSAPTWRSRPADRAPSTPPCRSKRDGRFRVVIGATPTGQGHDTTWAMVVADQTGASLRAVDVVHGDTDLVPTAA